VWWNSPCALYQTLISTSTGGLDVASGRIPQGITGRYSQCHTLRQAGAVALPERARARFDHFVLESCPPPDIFGAWHALPVDRRRRLQIVAVNRRTVPSRCMALEAINHAGHLPKAPGCWWCSTTNDMSISPPVGPSPRTQPHRLARRAVPLRQR